jgi:hypothetical protein
MMNMISMIMTDSSPLSSPSVSASCIDADDDEDEESDELELLTRSKDVTTRSLRGQNNLLKRENTRIKGTHEIYRAHTSCYDVAHELININSYFHKFYP